jgi:hypothetical protein
VLVRKEKKKVDEMIQTPGIISREFKK